MVRKLKFHEQKLLKKVDFLQWKNNDNPHEGQVLRRYHVEKRDDYLEYNKICGYITRLANDLSLLSPDDPFRGEMTRQLLEKLYDVGLIPTKNTLSQLTRVSASSLARRRLATVMVQKLKMSETLAEAATFIEQGHVRVGPDVVRDPSFLVTRQMEDYVTWVDQSKIRRKIMQYNDRLDDYDLMN